jgi:3-hydroxybutyrate dehydrogenase
MNLEPPLTTSGHTLDVNARIGKGRVMTKRVAIVTGAASGIGRAIAEYLADQQMCVVVADTNQEAGQTTATALGGYYVNADLTDSAQCHRLVDAAVERFGTVDVLINNAGFQHVAPIDEFPEEIWGTMLSLMLTAPFILTKLVWPLMKAGGWGRIVNISSVHGLVASPHKSAYVTAKHGLIGLTRTAALEGAALGITVNALCPSAVRTPLVEAQLDDLARVSNIPVEQALEKVLLEPAAIKRLMEPAQVAALVGYLVSDAGDPITGVAWPIDGGWTAS